MNKADNADVVTTNSGEQVSVRSLKNSEMLAGLTHQKPLAIEQSLSGLWSSPSYRQRIEERGIEFLLNWIYGAPAFFSLV